MRVASEEKNLTPNIAAVYDSAGFNQPTIYKKRIGSRAGYTGDARGQRPI
mgnify:CR=1 FL=1